MTASSNQIPLRQGAPIAALLVLSFAGCSSSGPSDASLPPASSATGVVFVAANGSDAASGARAVPFATIARALQSDATLIFVRAGRYDADLRIERPVELRGEGPETSLGDVVIAASATLASVSVRGAIQVDSGVVSVSDVSVVATGERGVVVRTATVNAARVAISGATAAQLQLDPGAVLQAADLSLTDGSVGLTVLRRSRASIRGGRIGAMRNFGVVVDRARVVLEDLTFQPGAGITIGIAGADVTVRDCDVSASSQGVVSVSNHIERAADVAFEGGTIRHGGLSAFTLGQGTLRISGVTFVGAQGAVGDDAIVARGPTADLTIESATFEDPAGFAVGVYAGARANLEGLDVRRPALGGVAVEEATGVRVARSTIADCQSGSGLVVLDATDVRIDAVRVDRCAEGGLLFGERSTANVDGATLTGNTQFGLGVFSASVVQLSNTTIDGSPQATFVDCASGARVADSGGNDVRGMRTDCP